MTVGVVPASAVTAVAASAVRTTPAVTAPAATVGHPYATPAFGTSRLSDEERDRVEILVERLKRDRTKGRIAAPEAELREMAIGVAESRRDGTNPRTSSKNELAWREFKAYAKWLLLFDLLPPGRQSIGMNGYTIIRVSF